MKKTSKIKWIAIPLALVLVLALSVMGFSALMAPQNPKVMLDGNAKDFVISGTDKKAANGNADLFPDMKNLMPGDSVTQKITVGVKNFSALDVKNVTIFMKADTTVDHEWFPKKQTHDITAAKYYGVALTNAAKVVLATFKA